MKGCFGSKVTAILLNGWICLLVELHWEGSAPASCAAGLFVNSPFKGGQLLSGCSNYSEVSGAKSLEPFTKAIDSYNICYVSDEFCS